MRQSRTDLFGMSKFSRIIKKIPIELLLTLLPFLVTVSFLPIFNTDFKKVVASFISLKTIYNLFLNNPFFKWGMIVILILIAYTMVDHYLKLYRAKKDNTIFDDPNYQKTIFEYFVIVIMVATTTLIGSMLTIWLTKKAVPESMMKASNLVMDLDWKIFSVYPPFWIHKFQNIPGLEVFLIWAYRQIPSIASAVFIVLLIKNVALLKKMILTLFLAAMISFPIWITVPAISPVGMYVSDTLSVGIPEKISDYIKSYPVSERLANNSVAIDQTYTFLKGAQSIQTFPSMHGAWAFIDGYFIFMVWPPLLIIFLPFLLGTMTGAMYVAQHYAVDIIAGILVATLTIIIVNYIYRKIGKI